MPTASFQIAPVCRESEIELIKQLFRDYAASLPIDLGFQRFEEELAGLPGEYAPPIGALLLARDGDGEAVGCVGMRRLAEGICEMKRLYVSPRGRGMGIGLALAEAFLAASERAGYREARLDTLPSLIGALALYRRLGFERMDAYYASPIAEHIFMRRALT